MVSLSAIVLLNACFSSLSLHLPPESGGTSRKWPNKNFLNTQCLVVVADFNKPTEVGIIAEKVQNTTGCSLYVVSKYACPDLARFSSALCTVVPNLGEDCATASHFVAHHYEGLPEKLVFIDSSFNWGREVALDKMLVDVQTEAANHFFCTQMHRGALRGQADFKLEIYYGEGKDGLGLASPRPLGKWVNEHTDFDDFDWSVPVCNRVSFRTTRDLLLQRPQSLYVNISRQLEQFVHPEAGHYCERMVGAMFAGRRKWWTDDDVHVGRQDASGHPEWESDHPEWEFDM